MTITSTPTSSSKPMNFMDYCEWLIERLHDKSYPEVDEFFTILNDREDIASFGRLDPCGDDHSTAAKAVYAATQMAFNHGHGWAGEAHRLVAWALANPNITVTDNDEKKDGQMIVDYFQPKTLRELQKFGWLCNTVHNQSHSMPGTYSYESVIIDGEYDVCTPPMRELIYYSKPKHVIRHRTATGRVEWAVTEAQVAIIIWRPTGPAIKFNLFLNETDPKAAFYIHVEDRCLPRHIATLREVFIPWLKDIVEYDVHENIMGMLTHYEGEALINLVKLDKVLAEINPEKWPSLILVADDGYKYKGELLNKEAIAKVDNLLAERYSELDKLFRSITLKMMI